MAVAALPRAIKIFFSYDVFAPVDKGLFDELMKQLSALRQQYTLDEWYDSAISAGSDVSEATIEAHLNMADIIVLLISADFLASKRCFELEMKRALERGARGVARLIPVILRPTEREDLPLNNYSPLPPNGKAVTTWQNRDVALSEVAKGIRRVVEELVGKMKTWTTRPDPVQFPLYHLPYRYNDFFTDRAAVLDLLTSSFATPPGQRAPMLALNGLGGTGKTQIALAYIQQASNLYQTVLWLDASSREQFAMEVSALAERLSLGQEDYESEGKLFAVVKQWLQEQKRWLLVLDHIDDMALVDLIVPTQGSGHVLLTTRRQALGTLATAIPIAQMATEHSVLFLLRRAKILAPQATLDGAASEDVQQATAIVHEMDGLPLGLDQAGAYIEETGCSLAAYLTLYRQERAALLGKRGRMVDRHDHPDSVAVTLALTFEKVAQRRAENIDLLRLLAFLHPDAIPDTLLEQGAARLREPLRSLLVQNLEYQQALSDLLSFSLIQRGADRKTMSIHRLVQAVLLEAMAMEQRRRWARQVVRVVHAVFPEASFETWAACERYVVQAQHCANLIRDYRLTLKEGTALLERLGNYCYQRACYDEAARYFMQALQLHEQRGSIDVAARAEVFNALGLVYYRQGKYQQAEDFQQRALAAREQEFGPDHALTAESLHNLAVLYGSQGRHQQAEQLYQRVLAIDQKEWGEEHAETAKTLSNLGLMRYLQGNYGQAQEAYQRALTIYEQTLSPDHPDLAYTLNSLGALHERQKDYTQAEELYQRAFVIREQALGEQHPDTAYSMNKLADIYETQGKYQQAEQRYQRALEISEQALGNEHPDVALLLNNLAFLAYKQGHYAQAEPLYQRALHIYQQTLDAEHITIASVLNNLGQLYRSTKEFERAQSFLEQALAIRQKRLGAEHPDTQQSMHDLTALLAERQRDEDREDEHP